MKRKADCPVCHEPVRMAGSNDYEKGILANKQLEQQVDIYKGMREDLRSSLVRLDVFEKERAMGVVLQNNGEGGKEEDDTTAQEKMGKRKEEQPSTRPSKRARRTVAKKSTYSENDSEIDNDDDEDFEDDSSNSKMPASSHHELKQPELKRKPTTNYHKLNKKKKAELCQKEGLSTRGTEDELQRRHSDFIALYNSECDSEHPRSVEDLVEVIKSRELSIKEEAAKDLYSGAKQHNKLMGNLGNCMKAYNDGSIDKPTSGNKAFDAEMKNNFKEMIELVKKRNVTNGDEHDSAINSNGGAQESGGIDGIGSMASLSNRSCLQQSASISESGRIRSASASTSATMGGIKASTPQSARQKNKHKQKSSPPSLSKATAKRASPQKFSRSNSRSSKVSNLGPWSCQACTFENMRNTTRTARCQMCDAVRPKELDLGKRANEREVVNIDC